MRKLIVVAALAAAGLIGAAACAENPTSGPTSPTPTAVAGGADETSQVCAEAIAEGTAAATELAATINEMDQALNNNEIDKLALLQGKLYDRMRSWQTKLTGWAGRNVKPEVKAALTEAAATLQDLEDPTKNRTTPTVAELQAKLTPIAAKLTAACA